MKRVSNENEKNEKKLKKVSHLANLSIFALSSGIGGSIVGDNVGIGDLTVSAAWVGGSSWRCKLTQYWQVLGRRIILIQMQIVPIDNRRQCEQMELWAGNKSYFLVASKFKMNPGKQGGSKGYHLEISEIGNGPTSPLSVSPPPRFLGLLSPPSTLLWTLELCPDIQRLVSKLSE